MVSISLPWIWRAAQQGSGLGVDQARRDGDQVAQFIHATGHHGVHPVKPAQFGGGLGIEQAGGTKFLRLGDFGRRRKRQAIFQGETAGIGDCRHHQIGDDGPGLFVQAAAHREFNHRRRHPLGRFIRRSHRSRPVNHQHETQCQYRFQESENAPVHALSSTAETAAGHHVHHGSSTSRNPKSNFPYWGEAGNR